MTLTPGERVPFEPDAVKAYLDGAITAWRKNRAKFQESVNMSAERDAACYIDAFQSVRTSLFGETLP